jgi:hypothetical protein
MSTKAFHQPSQGDLRKLRRRVFNYFKALTEGNAHKCFSYIDPTLIKKDAISENIYQQTLERFKDFYQKIDIAVVRTIFVPPGSKRDPRAFAYVQVIWFDAKEQPHVFRERWVNQDDEWFTRVLGYVAHENTVEKQSP